ncbi:hypothetical protein KWI83_11645 [Streptomyces sp. TRM70350]|nr:hypothetical protein [Streptomyces sp. TRM70350]
MGRAVRHRAYSTQQKTAAGSATPTAPCSAACCNSAEWGLPSDGGDATEVALNSPALAGRRQRVLPQLHPVPGRRILQGRGEPLGRCAARDRPGQAGHQRRHCGQSGEADPAVAHPADRQ